MLPGPWDEDLPKATRGLTADTSLAHPFALHRGGAVRGIESPEHPSQVARNGQFAIAGGVTQTKILKIFITTTLLPENGSVGDSE